MYTKKAVRTKVLSLRVRLPATKPVQTYKRPGAVLQSHRRLAVVDLRRVAVQLRAQHRRFIPARGSESALPIRYIDPRELLSVLGLVREYD